MADSFHSTPYGPFPPILTGALGVLERVVKETKVGLPNEAEAALHYVKEALSETGQITSPAGESAAAQAAGMESRGAAPQEMGNGQHSASLSPRPAAAAFSSDKQEKAKPLAYCILNRDGKMFWSESCIFSEAKDGADELEAVQLDDPDAGWHIAPFYADPSATLPSLFLTAVCEELFGCFMTPAENGIFRCACCDWPIDLRNWVDAEHDGGCLIPRVRNYLAKHKPECVKTQYVGEKPSGKG